MFETCTFLTHRQKPFLPFTTVENLNLNIHNSKTRNVNASSYVKVIKNPPPIPRLERKPAKNATAMQ